MIVAAVDHEVEEKISRELDTIPAGKHPVAPIAHWPSLSFLRSYQIPSESVNRLSGHNKLLIHVQPGRFYGRGEKQHGTNSTCPRIRAQLPPRSRRCKADTLPFIVQNIGALTFRISYVKGEDDVEQYNIIPQSSTQRYTKVQRWNSFVTSSRIRTQTQILKCIYTPIYHTHTLVHTQTDTGGSTHASGSTVPLAVFKISVLH